MTAIGVAAVLFLRDRREYERRREAQRLIRRITGPWAASFAPLRPAHESSSGF
ncbi:MAG: hypothetical protein ACRD96_17510 [Bryobacteraceae bacterium]